MRNVIVNLIDTDGSEMDEGDVAWVIDRFLKRRARGEAKPGGFGEELHWIREHRIEYYHGNQPALDPFDF